MAVTVVMLVHYIALRPCKEALQALLSHNHWHVICEDDVRQSLSLSCWMRGVAHGAT